MEFMSPQLPVGLSHTPFQKAESNGRARLFMKKHFQSSKSTLAKKAMCGRITAENRRATVLLGAYSYVNTRGQQACMHIYIWLYTAIYGYIYGYIYIYIAYLYTQIWKDKSCFCQAGQLDALRILTHFPTHRIDPSTHLKQNDLPTHPDRPTHPSKQAPSKICALSTATRSSTALLCNANYDWQQHTQSDKEAHSNHVPCQSKLHHALWEIVSCVVTHLHGSFCWIACCKHTSYRL